MQSERLDMLPDQFVVYIARHATPDRSRMDIPYHLPPGPDLTERGRQEAAQLGAFLQPAGVAHIFTSPLERAWQTGLIAGEFVGVAPQIFTDLAEWRPEENEKAVLERMKRAFIETARSSQAACSPAALVSHGAPVLTLLKWLGLPAELVERCRIYDSRNLIPMGGAWRVEREEEAFSMQLAFVPQGVKMPACAAEWPPVDQLVAD